MQLNFEIKTDLNLNHQIMPKFVTVDHILEEENTMRKARLLKAYKDRSDKGYLQISLEIFETERQVFRLFSLNNLIPEFQNLMEDGELMKYKAYLLAGCDRETQYIIFDKHVKGMQNKRKMLSKELIQITRQQIAERANRPPIKQSDSSKKEQK